MPDTLAATTRAQLASPDVLDALCRELVALGGVAPACEKLGLDRTTVWREARKNKELYDALWAARCDAIESRLDECPNIADDSSRDWIEVDGKRVVNNEAIQRSRLRIDTRMRYAGMLMRSVYGEKAGPDVNVNVGVGLVCDEATRARLIALHNKRVETERRVASPCRTEGTSSRVCELGTKCCEVVHSQEPVQARVQGEWAGPPFRGDLGTEGQGTEARQVAVS